MNCGEWKERLALYLGGDLPPAEAVLVEQHLGECSGCQVFSSGLKAGLELLQESHQEALAPAHFTAMRARVLAELESQRRPFWRRGWVFGPAALGLALLVTLAVTSWPRSTHRLREAAGGHPQAPLRVADTTRPGDEVDTRSRQSHPEVPPIKRPGRPKAQPVEPVLIKLVSDNPDVVIYWIAETRGD